MPDLDIQDHPRAKPVLVILLGSTSLAVAPQIHRHFGKEGMVPSDVLGFDRMDYDSALARVEQMFEIPAEVVAEALPRSAFRRPEQRLGADTDITLLPAPVRECLFEARIEAEARRNTQGSGGLPAVSAAHLLSNVTEIGTLIAGKAAELRNFGSNVDPTAALYLAAGLIVVIVTTAAGGTGTGGIVPLACIARHALRDVDQLEIHAKIILPPPTSDRHTGANASAMLQHVEQVNSAGGAFAITESAKVSNPLDSVTLIDWTNGTQTFDRRTQLAQAAAQIEMLLYAPMQSAVIAGFEVDLTGNHPRDHRKRASHGTRSMVSRIFAFPPSANALEAHATVAAEVLWRQKHLEDYRDTGRLNEDDERRVTAVSREIAATLGLNPEGLRKRLEDGRPSSDGAVAQGVEAVDKELVGLRAADIQALIPERLQQIRDVLNGYQAVREEGGQRLARTLPEQIEAQATQYLGHRPDLVVAALRRIRKGLEEVFASAAEIEARAGEQRIVLGNQVRQHLTELDQVGGGILSVVIPSDRRALDIATRLLETAQAGLKCRIEQESCAVLASSSCRDAVLTTLLSCEARIIREASERSATWRASLRSAVDRLTQAVAWDAGPFSFALSSDQASAATLKERASRHCELSSAVRTVLDRLHRGELTLAQAVAEVQPLLPSARTEIDLEQRILADPAAYRQVLARLSMAPPAPVHVDVVTRLRHPEARTQLTVLALPGGPDGALAKRLANDMAARTVAIRVIKAPDDAVTLYFTEGGFLMAAFQATTRLREAYQDHLRVGGISPHIRKDGINFPPLLPPTLTVVEDAQQAVAHVRAFGLDMVVALPAGGYRMKFRDEVSRDFFTYQDEIFPDFNAAINDLAKRPTQLSWYENQVKPLLERAYQDGGLQQKLLDAYHSLDDASPERRWLRMSLHRFKVDPAVTRTIATAKSSAAE